jgi:ABC-type nitrate/sulfonate/bicarbonate transport system permease component
MAVAPAMSTAARRGRSVVATVVAVVILMVVWELTGIASGGWVPSIFAVIAKFAPVLAEPATLSNMWITTYRILIAFVATTIVGSLLGIAMGLNRYFEAFFRPLVVISLAIPDPVYIIFAILILGTDESSGIIALAIAVLPFVLNVVHSAVKSRDTQLDGMATVYRFGRRRYLTEVIIGQFGPALIVAARTSFAFCWKVVVLVEAISQPLGVGSQIYTAFRLLRFDEMIAVAVVFIVLMRVVDTVAFGFLERRALAWAR